MIQLHIDILQNLQQAMFVLNIPSTADFSLQIDQFIINNEDLHRKTAIHFNGLIIDVNKCTEVAPPEITTNTIDEGQIRRTFKFPFLRLPKINDHIQDDLTSAKCPECQSMLNIIAENRTFKIVQKQNANSDDINEIIYCHRFCEAHEHEHQHEHQQQLHVPLDLHADPTVLETTECFIIAKEYISSHLLNHDRVQCNHCSSHLGSFDVQKNLISFDKCSLLPFSNDYLSSCFRHCEPGRYIVKVPKCNDSLYLIWILPNQILSADVSIQSTNESIQLNFHRKRKILYTHITSSDNKIFTEWKRDFSVTTLLVNQLCLDHLLTVFKQEIEKFPNGFNNKELFQSLTISF